LSKPWGPVGGGFETAVSLSTAATPGNDMGIVGLCEILYDFIGFFINDEGSRWDFDDKIIAFSAGFLLSLTMTSVFGFKLAFEAKRVQGASVRRAFKNYISAFTPIAAIGATAGDKFLTPETYTSATAVSGLNGNKRFIKKFHSA
jgi:hypothetical protein